METLSVTIKLFMTKPLRFILLTALLISMPLNQDGVLAEEAKPDQKLSALLVQFSKTHNPHFDPLVTQDIRQLENRLRTLLADQDHFRNIIRTWEQFFYSEKKLKYSDNFELNPNTLFVDEILKREETSRLGLAGIWVGMAEDMRVPFSMVLAPRHPFLLYDRGQGVRKYLEIGSPHRLYNLDYFRQMVGVREKNISSSAYFRPLHPQEIVALYRHALARIYARQGDLKRAGAMITQSKKDFPQVAEFSSDLGRILLDSGNPQAAKLEFEEALRYYAKDSVALQGLAEIAWNEGDLTQANENLLRVFELDPENLGVLRDLSMIQLIRMGLGEAENYLDAILRLKPEDPEALAFRATIQSLRGYDAKAKENFEISLKKGLDDARTLLAHGMRYFILGVHVDSGFLWRGMEYFRKAEEKDSRNWMIQYFIASTYFRGNDHERAREAFERTLELAPKSSEALLGLAQAVLELGDYEMAKDYIERASAIDPDLATLYFTRAKFDFRIGQLERAIREIKIAIAKAPSFQRDYWTLFLAELEIENQNPDQAMTLLDRILKEHPRYFDAYRLRGRIYLERGQLAEAERDLDLAFKYLSKNGDVLKLLAKLAYQQKDYNAAWRYIRGAARQGVHDPEFMAQLRKKSKEPKE